MQVTSNHLRFVIGQNPSDEGLTDCWTRFVTKLAENALRSQEADVVDAAPRLIKPSPQTMRQLKNLHSNRHHLVSN